MRQPYPNSRLFVREQRILVLIMSALICMLAFVWYFPGPSKPVPRDFACYYIAGKVFLNRDADALYFTDVFTGITREQFPESRFAQIGEQAGIKETSFYIYPPWVGILYAPLTALSPYKALVVAYLLGWVMTLVAFVLLARALPVDGCLAAAVVFVLMCLSSCFSGAVRAGQASIPVLLLLILFARALWTGREGQTGIWLALLTGIKLFPVLFIPYLFILRRWRALIAFGAAGVILLGISILFAGVDAHVRYLRLIIDYTGIAVSTYTNQSVTGFLLRLGDSPVRDWSVVRIPAAIAWTSRILIVSWLGLTLWIILKLRKCSGPWREPLGFSLMSIWVFSGCPNVWIHYMVALAVPMVVAAAFLGTQRGGGSLLAYLSWGAAWAGILLVQGYSRLPKVWDDVIAIRLLASLPLAGTLVLYFLLVALSRVAIKEPAG